MKNLLYVIAVLLIILWGVILLSFDTSALVHVILVTAGIIILIRVLFDKRLSKK